MRMTRILWRTALARFRVVRCLGCYTDAATDWYVNDANDGPYCPACAAKLANVTDTGESANQFYGTTQG